MAAGGRENVGVELAVCWIHDQAQEGRQQKENNDHQAFTDAETNRQLVTKSTALPPDPKDDEDVHQRGEGIERMVMAKNDVDAENVKHKDDHVQWKTGDEC